MDAEYLQKEIKIIQRKYRSALLDADSRYILIPDFSLPPGWNHEKTELMIEIPGGYPVSAPDNFYVTEGLRLRDGNTPAGYDEVEKFGRRWGRFSWHLEGTWEANAEPSRGDNLLAFILTIIKRLTKLE